jgi:hypothetical protein
MNNQEAAEPELRLKAIHALSQSSATSEFNVAEARGNPLENLDLVADPEKNFVVIMKDGKVYKNTH